MSRSELQPCLWCGISLTLAEFSEHIYLCRTRYGKVQSAHRPRFVEECAEDFAFATYASSMAKAHGGAIRTTLLMGPGLAGLRLYVRDLPSVFGDIVEWTFGEPTAQAKSHDLVAAPTAICFSSDLNSFASRCTAIAGKGLVVLGIPARVPIGANFALSPKGAELLLRRNGFNILDSSELLREKSATFDHSPTYNGIVARQKST